MALTAKFVATAKPGRHLDADGLYLNVSPTGRKTWVHSPTARRTGQIDPKRALKIGPMNGREARRSGL